MESTTAPAASATPTSNETNANHSNPMENMQQQMLAYQQQHQRQMMEMSNPNSEQLKAMYGQGMMMVPPYMMPTQNLFARMPLPGGGEVVEEEPVYVNAKQYHRIMIRRQQRAKLDAKLGSTARERKQFLHESRHKHAMRRPRGPGGRFLTKSEIEELEKIKAEKDNK